MAEITFYIDKLAFSGKALGRVEGFVVLVDQAVPGQKVRVCITRKKPQYAEARLLQVLEPSQAQIPPFCRHFGVCGGCQWQEVAYPEQLYWKRVHVQECLRCLPGLKPEDVWPALASPAERYYRNKMEFTFAPRPWDQGTGAAAGRALTLGLHVRGCDNGIFDLEECYLLSPQTPELVGEVRRLCRESALMAYNPRTRQGFWRFLVLREAKSTGQSLLHLITSDRGSPALVDSLAARLAARFPSLTTLVHSHSRKKAQVAVGEASRTIWGPGYLEERLGGLLLRVSAHSFLQTNTAGAEILYEAVRRLGDCHPADTVWDLYCGAGGIALSLARQAKRVLGFELVEAAVDDAYVNCRLNHIDNCRFLAGDLKKLIREVQKKPRHYPRPDIVITDPPRAGLHPELVEALKEVVPGRIVMVSCNPATLARDLALLADRYQTVSVQPVDLFPHTPHIECVARLEIRDTGRLLKKGFQGRGPGARGPCPLP